MQPQFHAPHSRTAAPPQGRQARGPPQRHGAGYGGSAPAAARPALQRNNYSTGGVNRPRGSGGGGGYGPPAAVGPRGAANIRPSFNMMPSLAAGVVGGGAGLPQGQGMRNPGMGIPGGGGYLALAPAAYSVPQVPGGGGYLGLAPNMAAAGGTMYSSSRPGTNQFLQAQQPAPVYQQQQQQQAQGYGPAMGGQQFSALQQQQAARSQMQQSQQQQQQQQGPYNWG